MNRTAGRPRIHGPKVATKIRLLRRKKWTWEAIAAEVQVSVGGCRKIAARKRKTKEG